MMYTQAMDLQDEPRGELKTVSPAESPAEGHGLQAQFDLKIDADRKIEPQDCTRESNTRGHS